MEKKRTKIGILSDAINVNVQTYFREKDIQMCNITQDLSNYDVIIPNTSIKQQRILAEKYPHKCLAPTSLMSSILDNKERCYDFVSKYVKMDGVELIPTYTLADDDFVDTFLVKASDAWSSEQQKKIYGNVHSIIKQNPGCQVQTIMDTKFIFAMNAVCKKGKILSHVCFKIFGNIHAWSYIVGFMATLVRDDDDYQMEILQCTKSIVKHANYSGFIEIEFLVAADSKCYFMEVNPRISGVYRMCNHDVNPYLEILMNTYIDTLEKKQPPRRRMNHRVDVYYPSVLQHQVSIRSIVHNMVARFHAHFPHIPQFSHPDKACGEMFNNVEKEVLKTNY
jgi:hypothetical protein